MRTLYLIGFMGSGKSTVGQELSKLLGIPCIDTDHMIENVYKVKIAEIFQNKGESVFRKFETEILKQTPVHHHIVSTGGGIVETEENITFMKANGNIVFLKTSLNEIEMRLSNDRSRPLWNKNSYEKQRLFDRRNKLYKESADIIIHTDDKNSREIAADIKEQAGLQSYQE
ncbi:shikimate kinase [Virgibacillus doumboii]|uniref:shikimate kinase n=1 Tax=Virgibacillus doumboii TaxID=2697503 RepID=UPI0013E027B1|nr:shikimate kinase [Virgibacillus doumboii]